MMSASAKFPLLARPVKIGAVQAKNSAFMASLTRNRGTGNLAGDVVAEYYTQRAKGGAGLILTEGTLITPQGTEWDNVPGIWDEEHAQAWKKTVDSVHKEGTPIVAQLWHVGRVAHPDQPEQKKAGTPVYAPSAVSARGGKFRNLPGQPGYVTPTAVPDPTTILDQYEHAAEMAKIAGFDAVELHSANGYLVEQFLSDVSNVREDQWGGSVENRTRFGLEAVKRLIKVYGADRVGIKLSPAGGYNDMYHSTPEKRVETFKYYVSELDKLGLAYIQIAKYMKAGDATGVGYDHDVEATYGPLIKNAAFLINLGFDGPSAEKALENGAKAVVFGWNWIANPDFYHRLQAGQELAQPDFPSLYNVQDNNPGFGYTSYPAAE